MIGLGIDTGGTCTDAVLYDMETSAILSIGKTLTTREMLEEGIRNAISLLDKNNLKKVSFVSLSTTLATNACVENRGGRVKLLFIGLKAETVKEIYADYGFESIDDLYFIDGVPEGGFCQAVEPDWDKLYGMLDDFSGAESIGIVQYFPEWNNAAFEKKAREIFEKHFDVPVICGSELFSDINAVRRGAGTYLNIRLIPIIKKFLQAVKNVLAEIGLDVPVYVVRSDGSLMNEEFTKMFPVETLLCGPAASAMGGAWMANQPDALVVDIGGTTTDIAALKNGLPVTVAGGIKINGWKTFVKGIYVDTFGLGGDSAVRFKNNDIYLESFRVIPIAMVAQKYPYITTKLQALFDDRKKRKGFIYEGFVLQGRLNQAEKYSQHQIDLVEKLKSGPLMFEEVGQICGRFNIDACVQSLEKENIIMRFGITPTDFMHVRGDYTAYCTQAPEIAIQYLAKVCEMDKNALVEKLYDIFRKKLYCNIVRVLLEKSRDDYKNGLPKEVEKFVEMTYAMEHSDWVQPLFRTDLKIVGVGGPAHIFMAEVGRKLGSDVYIHENAKVANAIGTLAGRVSVSNFAEFTYCLEGEREGFRFFVNGVKKIISDYESVVMELEQYLKEKAAISAKARGAKGQMTYDVNIEPYSIDNTKGSQLIGGKVTVAGYAEILQER
ncbi:hydantoinase/oxoprolinase family protein [Eubacteriaceae bacterium ES2]|nr:hydantoinase/oxoprolinase family protein [Eubacteriaceae bacterium ES2]